MKESVFERTSVSEGLDREEMRRADVQERAQPHFRMAEEPEPEHVERHIERHIRHPHEHAHVNLYQEEYTPEEVALLFGTSLEYVMHAIWSGDLQAERVGRNVVAVPRSALIAWYAASTAKSP